MGNHTDKYNAHNNNGLDKNQGTCIYDDDTLKSFDFHTLDIGGNNSMSEYILI
jgi:hypothetical protein